jgi:hypothetical protein
MNILKSIIKLFIPPVVFNFLYHFRNKNIQFQKTSLFWDDAFEKTSKGYSAEHILIKCRDSLLKVKNGEYPYERDSVLFTEKEIFYPIFSEIT